MKNELPHIINLPPFMFRGTNFSNLNLISKVVFIIKGKFLSFLVNYTNNKLFCKSINFFYSKDGKINYKDDLYYKTTLENKEYFYPNKRILRVVNNYKQKFNSILEAYCINNLDLNSGDTVVDCGANVGEIYLALLEKNIMVNYYGFEPDKATFKCLSLNTRNKDSQENDQVFNIGLSDSNESKKLYLDNDGGNTSLIDFGTDKSILVECKTLDSFKIKEKIKLLKVDAEGFEPEVLNGSVLTLKKTEYVSIDFGAERGLNQDTTVVQVNEFLYENNFSLCGFSQHRLVGLYKNNDISN
tara:strand:+ start:234 stop:1130 length:897 start_codon:yes stop_codon:yes gene_type:complete